jgi:hypothetical protein
MHLLQERDGGDGGEEGGVREGGLCRDWSQAESPLPLYVPPAPEEGGKTRYYSFNYLHLFKLNKEHINSNYGATVIKNIYSGLNIVQSLFVLLQVYRCWERSTTASF